MTSLFPSPTAQTRLSPALETDAPSRPPPSGLILLSLTPAFISLLGGDLFFFFLWTQNKLGVHPHREGKA